MPTALSFRYARALADVALSSGADPAAVMGELDGFAQALASSPEMKKVLQSPAVAPVRKRAVIVRLEKALAGSGLVRRFLLVLIDHRRIPLLEDIRAAFQAVIDERLGVVRAEVATARPLNERQRTEILDGLSRLTGKQARASFAVREELIGGAVARVGSTVYDGSVRGQLEAMRQKLAGVEMG
jgi:F-type H+-transporting ATPase subunit delta